MLRVALLFLVVVAWSAPALAQPLAERKAHQLVEEGLMLLGEAEYQAAADAFLEAYGQHPNPQYVMQAARALHSLGQAAVAANLYLEFLRLDPRSTAGPDVRRALKTLEPRVKRTHGKVRFISQPPGALITLEETGQRLGRAPHELWLPHGLVLVRMTVEGHPPQVHRVDVAKNSVATVRIAVGAAARQSAGKGTFRIRGLPRNAQVSIDGQRLLTATGTRAWKVTAKKHTLRVVAPGRDAYEQHFEVAVDGVTIVDLRDVAPGPTNDRMTPIPEPRDYRVAGWTLIGVGLAAVVAGATLHGLSAADGADQLGFEDGRVIGAWAADGVGLASLITGAVLVGVSEPLVAATPLPGGAMGRVVFRW